MSEQQTNKAKIKRNYLRKHDKIACLKRVAKLIQHM